MSKLINCPDCGHQVSSGAKSCPNCGRVISSTVATLVVWAVVIVLGAIVVNEMTLRNQDGAASLKELSRISQQQTDRLRHLHDSP